MSKTSASSSRMPETRVEYGHANHSTSSNDEDTDPLLARLEVEVDNVTTAGTISGQTSLPSELRFEIDDNNVEGFKRSELHAGAVGCLLLQHLSNTFNAGLYDFASFLFLIEIFRDTLAPASLVGLVSTLTGLVFSGWTGGLVDSTRRIRLVRWMISFEKILYVANYSIFCLLFGPLGSVASGALHGSGGFGVVLAVRAVLLMTILISSALTLAKTGLTVAFERDWVTAIAQGDQNHLTFLNSWMRRIDLCSKLGAPLFVSLLTSWTGYGRTTFILLCMALVTLATEVWWIQIVYDRFPVLREQPHTQTHAPVLDEDNDAGIAYARSKTLDIRGIVTWMQNESRDWMDFARLPVFCSSIAIASIYLTTLSYDGTFISYIKAARGWDDTFIALMRGVCVVTGILGTLVMPRLEAMIGLERAGAWSIWSETACLVPVVAAFFVGAPQYGERGSTMNSFFLFGGIASSRIGLWSFDLCQLKELQLALDNHPRRNRLTALQISLQNLFNLLKYVLTLILSNPASFKYTAVVSWMAVFTGASVYAIYLRKVRGHLIHFEWFKKMA